MNGPIAWRRPIEYCCDRSGSVSFATRNTSGSPERPLAIRPWSPSRVMYSGLHATVG